MSTDARLCTLALALLFLGCGSDPSANSNNNQNTSTSICGDGVLDQGEVCDDGELNSDSQPDACRTSCRLYYCGDGVVDQNEACDESGANSDRLADACRTDCALPTCGDGVVDSDERCDDGNTESGDGCSADCDMEPNWECSGSPSDCQCQPFFRGNHCSTCVAVVNQSATPEAADGLGWDTAYADIQRAIDQVSVLETPCEVWIAEGSYHQYRTNRGDSLHLRTNVSLYGGFAGDETARSARDIAAHPTLLLGSSPNGQHQVFHVITAQGVVDAMVSGVTVTAGRADGDPTYGDDRGGGVQTLSSSVSFDNVLFEDNVGVNGGAVYAYSSNLRFAHCRFDNNAGLRNGGALYASASDVLVTDSAVVRNDAGDLADLHGIGGGGGMYVELGLLRVERSVISKNDARSWLRGGGAFLVDSQGSLELIESLVLSNNTGNEGGAIQALNGGAMTIHGCVLSANTTINLMEPVVLSATGFTQGMWISNAVVRIKRSWLLNHFGPLMVADPWSNVTLISSVLAGNVHWNHLLLSDFSSNLDLGNCTIVGNDAPSLASFTDSRSMVNSIVWDNPGTMTTEGTQVTTCDLQNLPTPTSPTNFSSAPGFRGGPSAPAHTGTADISTDPDTYELVLQDAAATHTPGGLVGLAVLVDGDWFAIRSNTVTEIRAWGGDAEKNYPATGAYQIIDLRLDAGSGCLDVGDDNAATRDGSDLLEIPWSDDPGGNANTVTDLGAYAGAP